MYGYDGYGYSTPSSGSVTPPPEFTTQPSISGTTTEGLLLTCDPGIFSNGVVTLIEWRLLGEAIPGAVGATYQCRPADVGLTLTARVVVVGVGGSVEATTAATALIAATTNQVTFASYNGVTFNGTTAPTTAGAYTPDLIGGGTGQTSVFSGTNGRIANGRLWFVAGCIYGYGPQRADQSVSARFRHRSVVASTVVGVTLRNGGAAAYNGYHVFWVQASAVWRLTNGNTASLGGAFTDIADSAFSASNEERIVHLSAIGTTITYTIINPDTGAVIGTRTGTNATYTTGWGGLRQQSATVSSETTGVTVDWCATYTDSRSAHVFLVDGPATVNEDAASTNFVAMMFGTPPATVTCFATATNSGVVTPATALPFAAVHASHPMALQSIFTVTPPNEGNLSVALSCVHVTPRIPRNLFSISATPPAIRSAFTVRRGVNTPLNGGDVDLNSLLLTAGYVDQWNISFISGTGGGVAGDWNGIANGQSRFPTPSSGSALTGKGYVFRFTSAADAGITVDLTVICPANVVTVSKQADIDTAMGTASSTNITLAGRIMEVARGTIGFVAGMNFSRHNSQLTSANQLTIQNEDDAFPALIGGVSGFNNNRVTWRNLSVSKVDGTTICFFYATSNFSVSDQNGVGLIAEGMKIEGPLVPNQLANGFTLRGTANANPILRDILLKNVGNGFNIGTGSAGLRITSILLERCYVLGFSDNAYFFGGTTGTCRDVDCIAERPRRDRRYGQDEIDNTHLDDDQGPDGETYGRRETERFIGLQGSGDAGCQGKFANGGATAGFEKNIIIMRPSGSHAWRRLTNWTNMEYSCGTLIHTRQGQHPDGAWLGSDLVQGENTPNGSPSLGIGTGDDSNSARRIWSMGRGDAATFTGGIVPGVGLRSRQIGNGNSFSAADDPANLFTGWAALPAYDWTAEVSRATRVQQVLDLLKPVSTSVLHLPDGTYTGAVANNGGVAIWNDEGSFA